MQFGEIGSFRLAVGSTGSKDVKSFNASQIKKPKIVFTPGNRLQETRLLTTFERVADPDETADSGGGEEERPGEL